MSTKGFKPLFLILPTDTGHSWDQRLSSGHSPAQAQPGCAPSYDLASQAQLGEGSEGGCLEKQPPHPPLAPASLVQAEAGTLTSHT